jgi:hypothetical protein
MLYTTLTKIHAHGPCKDGWRTLLKTLGKIEPDDARLSLLMIKESNGPEDALWCLRAVDNVGFFARRFALDCARTLEHLSPDPRVKACNDTVERFLQGRATKEELDAARAAAFAARAAAYVAQATAYFTAAATCDAAASAAASNAVNAAYAAWNAYAFAPIHAQSALSEHFVACLKAWPKGEWPKMKPIKVQ